MTAACCRARRWRTNGRAVQILSINDHPEIRRVFAGFQMEEVGIDFQVGGGGKAVARTELIIYSWDRAAELAGLF